MSRLTEREINLIQEARARNAATQIATEINVDDIVRRAHYLRSQAMSHSFGVAGATLARWTGLSALAALAHDHAYLPVRDALRRRRTIRELSRLDDRMLADIGLERGAIESIGDELTARAARLRPSAPVRAKSQEGLFARLRRWQERRATVAKLEALSDRQLEDIGILRGDIEMTVEKALLESTGTAPLGTVRKTAAERRKVSTRAVQNLTRDTFAVTHPVRVERRQPVTAGRGRQDNVPPMWLGPWLPMMPNSTGR